MSLIRKRRLDFDFLRFYRSVGAGSDDVGASEPVVFPYKFPLEAFSSAVWLTNGDCLGVFYPSEVTYSAFKGFPSGLFQVGVWSRSGHVVVA